MNYYNQIKKELISNEINKKVKDFSKNKYELEKYYNVGKLLHEAGKEYGKNIIKQYSEKLMIEVGTKYTERNLRYMRQLYETILETKCNTLCSKLCWSH